MAEEIDSRMENQAVVDCLNTLTHVQRQAIGVVYYDTLTSREAADQLHVTVPALKPRLRDGLLRLKTCLEPALYDNTEP